MNESTKTSQAQMNATNNYRNKSLGQVNFVISPKEQDVFDALELIMKHHDGKKAPAIKAAILAYSAQLQATKKAD